MARPKGSPKVAGRAKGTTNKNTAELKNMILGALDACGGQKYLEEQAYLNPVAFMALIAKILPRDIVIDATINVADELENLRQRRLRIYGNDAK